MPRSASAPPAETLPDIQGYNHFVAGVQPRQIELGEVSASALPSDRQDVQVKVESRFVMSCPHRDDAAQTFTVEARLNLVFRADDGGEVGQFTCLYRLNYQADGPLTDAHLEEFTRRNAPVNVWPFMRELVLNLTQRFGWTGFVLPSFLIRPGQPVGTDDSAERKSAPPKKKAASGAASPEAKTIGERTGARKTTRSAQSAAKALAARKAKAPAD